MEVGGDTTLGAKFSHWWKLDFQFFLTNAESDESEPDLLFSVFGFSVYKFT